MAQTFAVATFGCKVNQYDSQAVREVLAAAGLREVSWRSGPDFIVMNTCAVTATAEAKARRLLHRIRRDSPGSRIVLTGCLVDGGAELARDEGVWRALRNAEKLSLADVLRGAGTERGTEGDAPARSGHGGAVPLREREGAGRAEDWLARPLAGFAGHSRAFLKIQDGCDAGCAYCIVPTVRGRSRSRPAAEVVAEAAALAERYREVVLAGIHLGDYRDADGTDLAGVVEMVMGRTGVERLRLSSIELNEVSPRLVEIAAADARLCPHFHVPLQSGSDAVLGRMNRRYTAGEFLAALERIRGRIDRPSFTTDVIVGFPGETDADFERTMEAAQTAGFSRVHIFPFSARPGTAAAEMDGRVAADVVRGREERLARLAEEMALSYRRQFIDEAVPVLVQDARDRAGMLCGYSDRYVRVSFEGPDSLRRRIVGVRVSGFDKVGLAGSVESS